MIPDAQELRNLIQQEIGQHPVTTNVRQLQNGPKAPTYTVTTRPPAAAHTAEIIFVSDAAAGAKFQGSDGAGWVNLG